MCQEPLLALRSVPARAEGLVKNLAWVEELTGQEPGQSGLRPGQTAGHHDVGGGFAGLQDACRLTDLQYTLVLDCLVTYKASVYWSFLALKLVVCCWSMKGGDT